MNLAALRRRTALDNLATLAGWIKRAEARGDRAAAGKLVALRGRWQGVLAEQSRGDDDATSRSQRR